MPNHQEPINLSEIADRVFRRLAKAESIVPLQTQDQVFICTWALQGEVDNGGFEQFYFNTSGDWALLVPEALRKIGANAAAKLMEEANSIFRPTGPSSDRQLRHAQLDALSDEDYAKLSRLSSRISEILYDGPERLDALLTKYLKNDAAFSNRS